MTEARALIAAFLLAEAAHHSGVLRLLCAEPMRRPRFAEFAWLLFLGLVAVVGAAVFPRDNVFLGPFLLLFGVQAVRLRFGMITEGTFWLERWRYVPAAVALGLSGDGLVAFVVAAVFAANARTLRAFLLLASRIGGPISISPLDVDRIAPPPVEYARREPESGIMLTEAVIGMTLLATLCTALFTAAATRHARLRSMQESSRTREAAVSELEVLGAVPFAELAGHDGRAFPVPGTGEPGTIAINPREEGLVEVRVTAPRRGSTPIRLTTLRSRRAE